MTRTANKVILPETHFVRGAVLVTLLALMILVIIGPSGLLAWGENARLLEHRKHEIKALLAERDSLKNQVRLLDPLHTDADLVGELLRRDQNLVHPDEVVIDLPDVDAKGAR